MGSFYESEVERQKKGDTTVNTILPILAALETIATAKATRGQSVGTSTLGLIKDTHSRRADALERAQRGDDRAWEKNAKTAEIARQGELFNFQKAAAGREKSKAEKLAKEEADKTRRMAAIRRNYLGSPAEMDSSGAVIKPAVPGIADLSEHDRNAIEFGDPIEWLTNKLKPAPTQLMVGGDGTVVPVLRTTGKTPDGKTVTPPPPASQKSLEQIAAEAAARVAGAAKGEKDAAGLTTIPGLTAIKGATITNDGIKKVQDIAVRKDELVNSIKRLQSLYDKHGTQLYGDTAREMESLVKGIQLTAKEFYNLGVLNGPDLGLMEQIIANPTGMKENLIGMMPGAGDPVSPKLNEALSLIDGRFKSTIKRYGFEDSGNPNNATQAIPDGTEKINKQGVKVRMTGGKWQPVQ